MVFSRDGSDTAIKFLTAYEIETRIALEAGELPRRLLETVAALMQIGHRVTVQALVAEVRRLQPSFTMRQGISLFDYVKAMLEWFERNGDIDQLSHGRYACPPTFAVAQPTPRQGRWRLHIHGSPICDSDLVKRTSSLGGAFSTTTYEETVTPSQQRNRFDGAAPVFPVGYSRSIVLPDATRYDRLSGALGIPVFDSTSAVRAVPLINAALLTVPAETQSGGGGAPGSQVISKERYDCETPGYWSWVGADPQHKAVGNFSLWRLSTDDRTFVYYVRPGANAPLRIVEHPVLIPVYMLALDRRSGNPRSLYISPSNSHLFVPRLTPESATRWLAWLSGSPLRRERDWLECRFDSVSEAESAASCLSERFGYIRRTGTP